MPKAAIADSLSDWEGLLASAGSLSLDDALLGENLEELRSPRTGERASRAGDASGRRAPGGRPGARGDHRAGEDAGRPDPLQAQGRLRSHQRSAHPLRRQTAAARPRRLAAGAFPGSLQKRVDPRQFFGRGAPPSQIFPKNLEGEASPANFSGNLSAGGRPPPKFCRGFQRGGFPREIFRENLTGEPRPVKLARRSGSSGVDGVYRQDIGPGKVVALEENGREGRSVDDLQRKVPFSS